MNTDSWESWAQRMRDLLMDMARRGNRPFGLEAMDKGFEAFLRLLFAKEAEHRKESEAAVQRYILDGTWTAQSKWAEYITVLRVRCAADFANQMIGPDYLDADSTPCGLSPSTVQSWLLIDHWNLCFDTQLKLAAVSLFYSLPYYGLTPATD